MIMTWIIQQPGRLPPEVLTSPAFYPVSEELMAQAKAAIDICQRVVSLRKQFGVYDSANKQLYEYAVSQGKLKEFTLR